MNISDLPHPDTSVGLVTKALTYRASWPGYVEVVYTCGHIVCLKLTDDLPVTCIDVSHTPPPVSTPVIINPAGGT